MEVHYLSSPSNIPYATDKASAIVDTLTTSKPTLLKMVVQMLLDENIFILTHKFQLIKGGRS